NSGTSFNHATVQLGALAFNGGPTQTMQLLAGPAIDIIPVGVNNCGIGIHIDQRGVFRPQGVKCDIGAYEANAPLPPPGRHCVGTFPGHLVGNLFVQSDSSCVFLGGSVTGDIHVSGGLLDLSNVTVNGNIEATGGTLSIGPATNISGNVAIHQLSGN